MKIRALLFTGLLAVSPIPALLPPSQAAAVTGSDWSAGRIIDDAVFYNSGSMNSSDVQNFLNAKVPTCDTNGQQTIYDSTYKDTVTRATYSQRRGVSTPFTCLKNYTQDVAGTSSDAFCAGSIAGGHKTAAGIIKEVADACGISPKALIVILQKEQNLVTDDWPWPVQYQEAMGYGCPDTAPCDTQYYGFFNQVYNAAHQFQRYAKQSNLFNYADNQTSFVGYNPNSGCGGTNVYIENRATAGLYNYTPYQPNAAALNNLYGSGDGCSAYGNRNFWRFFNDWFGSTKTNIPFAWEYVSQQAFVDSDMTLPFTDMPTVAPGATLYAKVRARNVGNQPWYQNVILGTTHPNNRTSPFTDSSWWLNGSRPAHLLESSVAPGQIGTFTFAMKGPSTTGTYKEYFNILIEGQTWFNDPGLFYIVNVVSPVSARNGSYSSKSPGFVLHPNEYILSPDLQSMFILQDDGNLVLYTDFKPVWSSNTAGQQVNRMEIQGDGNMVLFRTSDYSAAVWDAGTWGHPNARLDVTTNGNAIISDGGVDYWATNSTHIPDNLGYVNPVIFSENKLYPGQQLETADRKYRLLLQNDGNLVLYSPTRAIWTSQSAGQQIAFLAIQRDGNLVLYRKNFSQAWSSHTVGRGAVKLVLQQDGNVVLYTVGNVPIWTSQTAGQQ